MTTARERCEKRRSVKKKAHDENDTKGQKRPKKKRKKKGTKKEEKASLSKRDIFSVSLYRSTNSIIPYYDSLIYN